MASRRQYPIEPQQHELQSPYVARGIREAARACPLMTRKHYNNCRFQGDFMANRTPLARRTQIINCLVEGNSIRSTERMTDTHRDTIMRLMVEVGNGCAALHASDGRERD